MSADNYRGSEPESQVRSIIKQLNDERPSKEKSREVVVRPDGTKVVRVIKKRKVTISSVEKNRHAKKRFLLLLLLLLLMGGAMAVIVSVRMSAMAGESYIVKRQDELCRAWGASSVHCTGAGISGFSMQIASVVVEFPETSFLKRVEMRNISASLATTSFFSGVPESDELKMESAVVVMREGVQSFSMPRQEGNDLWKFKRVNCKNLSFYIGDESTSPLSIKHANAYMYQPPAGKDSRVLIMSDGVLQMQGWRPIVITDAKMKFTSESVDDIHVTGTLDVEKREQDTASSHVAISGSVRSGADMAGPFAFESANINFSDLSDARYTQFFNGTTAKQVGQSTLSAYVSLPIGRPKPIFTGSFYLKDVRITSFPALRMITEHLEPIRRKGYLPPTITAVTVDFVNDGEKSTLRIANGNAVERELISLRADVSVDAVNQLSGTLDYGIPSKLTHMEYPDGLADPIFTDDGVYAWLATTVSGPANAPTDNSAELDAQAAIMRSERPARIPFDELDVDDFSVKMKERTKDNTTGVQSTAAPAATQTETPTPQSQGAAEGTQQPATGSGFDLSKLPTSLPSDSSTKGTEGGGLSLPMDDNFFPGLHH